MAANTDAIIREGIAAYKAGRKEEARAFLLRAVEIDQYNEQAWLWLSAVVESQDDQRTCLENVLAINPDNERARHGLDVLSTPNEAPPPPSKPPTPKPQNNDFPTSVEWGAAAPTADAFDERATTAPEISDEEYDDWVANLNLPTTAPTPAAPGANDNGFTSSSPFDSAFFDDSDDDLSDDFSQTGSTFFDSNDDALPDNFDSPNGAFFGSNDDALPDNYDVSNGAFTANPFSTLDFETVFGSPDAAVPPPPPPEPPRAGGPSGLMSPGREADSDDAGDIFSDVDLTTTGVFADFGDDDFTDTELESLNADELFQYIPPEIAPTRLPGTRERYPAALVIGLVLLLLLNAGAVALLVYRLV